MKENGESIDWGWRYLVGKDIRLQCGETLITGTLNRFSDLLLEILSAEIWIPGKYRTDAFWTYVYQSKITFCFETGCAIESSEYDSFKRDQDVNPKFSDSEIKEMIKNDFPELANVKLVKQSE